MTGPLCSARRVSSRLISLRRLYSPAPAPAPASTSPPLSVPPSFFKYTWGSWLQNDTVHKKKRQTRFSLQGLNTVLNQMLLSKETSPNAFPVYDSTHHFSTLPSNTAQLNTSSLPIHPTTLTSIHEGRRHRIYRVDTSLGKSFVLRIPYPKDDPRYVAQRLHSEVATMDFVQHNFSSIRIPKIYAFAPESNNPIEQPFILQDYIDGQLLMKDWNPLCNDGAEELQKVLSIVMDFQSELHSLTFNSFGSLYFNYQESGFNQSTTKSIVSDGSKNNKLDDSRWKISSSMERPYWKGKTFASNRKYIGPWPLSHPWAMAKDFAELEARQSSLSLQSQTQDSTLSTTLRNQISTFQNLALLIPILDRITCSSSIPNRDQLLKPRLVHPDLDPMNILISPTDKTPVLLDFEGSSLKPLLLTTQPQFIQYDGPKIYTPPEPTPDISADSPQFEQLQFMYKRSRNQQLWESLIFQKNPEWIQSISPLVKLLRSPYTAALQRKSNSEYLLIQDSIIQLKSLWNSISQPDLRFPLQISQDDILNHNELMNDFHRHLLDSPFEATKGWIPQDLFNAMLEKGEIEELSNGDYAMAKKIDK
ncbi:hypothetical protein TBLA_0F01950 [Henningerozyma blattae CBS 6284]|uniref:Altered inheritance of mitochondria protein 9, mitochondrial n=1 Tax=Henningerozyma blattae (strain ATCC 34711 / CBS 6284 / DSM 70876 / NBRC 10599 / NRRL Y-10934 / UCD 77-7) TaxID=1071380 RepID=I2H5T5_HENB6|nr:hypothetical protein TBLA_0F01950 [Tetrapisispora blattae CBS 6284]CCH61737.1 hypothetical protein TBLA_0F01950 [Tetrapisispora blattae CBS 6284]